MINQGKFGISVWTQVLLDKFAYGRPSQLGLGTGDSGFAVFNRV